MEWDWGWLLTFAGAAGLLSAAFNQIFRLIIDKFSSKRTARFLALRLAVLCETYGKQCADTAEDAYTFISSDGAAGEWTTFADDFPDLPVIDQSWELIKPGLMHRLLSFSYLVTASNNDIRYVHDVTGELDDDETLLKTLRFGIGAHILARDLRHAYDLPGFEESVKSRIAMAERVKTIEEKRRQREAEIASRPAVLELPDL